MHAYDLWHARPVFEELPPTGWTQILRAKASPELERATWNQLLTLYWRPLFVFARRKGLTSDAAEDAVQSFAEHALRGELLLRADPNAGRLRAFLAIAFQNHLRDRWSHERALKRGGGERVLRIDTDVGEANLGTLPAEAELCFEVAWAHRVFHEALEKTESELTREQIQSPELLLRYLRGDALPALKDLASERGVSVAQLKSFFHRGREKMRRNLRTVVGETVANESELEAELNHIGELLRA